MRQHASQQVEEKVHLGSTQTWLRTQLSQSLGLGLQVGDLISCSSFLFAKQGES